MNIQNYLEEMKKIHSALLEYLEDIKNVEENFGNLKDLLDEIKIINNQHLFKSFLYLIMSLSNEFNRNVDLISKIEKIILLFKDDMKMYFENEDIFHIFKRNKRILLFLFKNNIITVDEYIVKKIINWTSSHLHYIEYFLPEIKPFFDCQWFPKYILKDEKIQKLPEDFDIKREKGENDNYICSLIRNDSIKDFIKYTNINSYDLNSYIDQSIYETNLYLLNHSPNLIEYSAFYGSIQIFNYLKSNNVELGENLWLYAIHGNNAEIIKILEENNIQPEDKSYNKCLEESIKCHHIDLVNYIQNYLMMENKKKINYNIQNILKYYCFQLIQDSFINELSFIFLCKYDYYILVKFLLTETNIDINRMVFDKIYI